MTCAPCEAAAAAANLRNGRTIQVERTIFPEQLLTNEECAYKLDILHSWYNKLDSIQKEGKTDLLNISSKKLNSYLGIIKSAINFKRNLCFYAPQLSPIVPIIQIIDAI